MAVLPVTVNAVDYRGNDTYAVSITLADGTTHYYTIPSSVATLEGVQISAVAVATLLDPNITPSSGHHRGHRRYDPRSAT